QRSLCAAGPRHHRRPDGLGRAHGVHRPGGVPGHLRPPPRSRGGPMNSRGRAMNVRWSACVASLVAMALFGPRPARAQHAAQQPAQQPVQQLSLKDAESLAVQNQPRIRGQQYTALAAGEIVRQVNSAYFPTAVGSFTGAQALDGSRIAAGGLNNPIILDRFAYGFSASQMITDFGRTRNLASSASLHADAAEKDVAARRAEALLDVDRTYFDALRAQAVLRVAEQTVAARQTVVDQVTALASSGLKSTLDVSFARVNLSEAQLLLVQAQ